MSFIKINQWLGRVGTKTVIGSPTKSHKGKRKPPRPREEYVLLSGEQGNSSNWIIGLVLMIAMMIVMIPVVIMASFLTFLSAALFKLPGVVGFFKVLLGIYCKVSGTVEDIYGITKKGAGVFGTIAGFGKDAVTGIAGVAGDGLSLVPGIGDELSGFVNYGGKVFSSPFAVVEKAADLAELGLKYAQKMSAFACSLQDIIDDFEKRGYKDAFGKALNCANWDAERYGPLDSAENSEDDGTPSFCIEGGTSEDKINFFIPPWLVDIYKTAAAKYNVPWPLLAAINLNDTNLGQGEWTEPNKKAFGRVGWIPFTEKEWEGKAHNDSGGVAADFFGNPYSGKKGTTLRKLSEEERKNLDELSTTEGVRIIRKRLLEEQVDPRTCAPPVDVGGSAVSTGFSGGDDAGAGKASLDKIPPYPGDDAPKNVIAEWMGVAAKAHGLPAALPVMAALVESNLQSGLDTAESDADSAGFFQMRVSIWDQGRYKGYRAKPELQMLWFLDEALKDAAGSEGRGYLKNKKTWGEFIANVEQPAAQYRFKYQTRLEEAEKLVTGGGGAVPRRVSVSYLQDGQFDTCDPVDGIHGLAQWLRANGAQGSVWEDALKSAEKSGGSCGTASAKTGSYPLSEKGKIIATPQDHASRALGNWESDNAVDIGVPAGTDVLAVEDGTIVNTGGSAPTRGPGVISGYSITLKSKKDQFFYTHLVKSRVKVGDKVEAGDVMGKSGYANNVDHLHIGAEKGAPMDLWAGGDKGGGSASCSSAGGGLSGSAGKIIWPTKLKQVISPFGPRSGCGICSTNHQGIDIPVPNGTPLFAVQDGVIKFTQTEGESGGYGNFTCMTFQAKGPTLDACYAHQTSFKVKPGDKVKQGQMIGISGSTGNITGPHLHFEIHENGQPIDPMPSLKGAATADGSVGGGDTATSYSPKCLTEAQEKFPNLEKMLKPGELDLGTKNCLNGAERPGRIECIDPEQNITTARRIFSQASAAGETFEIDHLLLVAITAYASQNGCNLAGNSAGKGWTDMSDVLWKDWRVDTDDGDAGSASRGSSTDALFSTARFLRARGGHEDPKRALEAYFAGRKNRDRLIGLILSAAESLSTDEDISAKDLQKSTIGSAVQERNHLIDEEVQVGDDKPCEGVEVYVECIAALYGAIVNEYEKDSEDEADIGSLGGGCGTVNGSGSNKKIKIADLPELGTDPLTTGPRVMVKNKQRPKINTVASETYGRKDVVTATVAVTKAFQECYPEYKKNWKAISINDFGGQLAGNKYCLSNPGCANGHKSHQNGADNDYVVQNVTAYGTENYNQEKAIVLAALFLRAGVSNIYFNDPEIEEFFVKNRAQEAKQEPKYKKKYKAWSDKPLFLQAGHDDHFHNRWYLDPANSFPPKVQVWLQGGGFDIGSNKEVGSAKDCTPTGPGGQGTQKGTCQYGPYSQSGNRKP